MQTPVPAGSTTERDALFVALGLVTLAFIVVIVRALRARAAAGDKVATPPSIWGVSFVANFFDTLGIGSFATTTSMFRQWRLVPDERIPGTLNVGYALPTVVQAYIYTKIVPVDSKTLIALIVSAVLGAWLGAGVVSSWSRRKVQIGMGICLLAAALIMALKGLNVMPAGGQLLGLSGASLAMGIIGNFILGALMTLGIGLYAPCMILVSLLGMNSTTAFPIMMGSCAFLMPLASVRFVRTGGYDARAMVGMMLAGIPAVLIAAFLVTSLTLTAVQWLVVVVVTYTAINMLRAARRERNIAATATAAEAQPAI
jgi:uncharacterized membrane protein YfcA